MGGAPLIEDLADQMRDAFRAAGYPSDTAAGFAEVLRARIAQLSEL